MPGADVPQFATVTIDCPEPLALARFYAALLEWPLPDDRDDDDGDFVAIDPPAGGTAITFQRVAEFAVPTWPEPGVAQQFHLDLSVDDLEAAQRRAVALGARLLDTQPKFAVFADPVGHPFCLCRW